MKTGLTRRRAAGSCEFIVSRRTVHKRASVIARDVQAVFVSTEVAPWSKSGGLGDVLQALPVALARRGLACMTVAPLYKPYSGTVELELAVPISVNLASSLSQNSNNSLHVARLHVLVDNGVLRVFVDHPFFAVDEGGIYSSYTVNGEERDVPAAMDVLCQASMAAAVLVPSHVDQLKGWVGGPLTSDITGQAADQDGHTWDVQTVFVANDWPTAILPLHLLAIQMMHSFPGQYDSPFPELRGSTQVAIHSRPPLSACQDLALVPGASPADIGWHEAYSSLRNGMQDWLQSSKVVMALHNMAYQGAFGPEVLSSLSLPQELFHFLEDEAERPEGSDDEAHDELRPGAQAGTVHDGHAGGRVGVGEHDGDDKAPQQPGHVWSAAAATAAAGGVRDTGHAADDAAHNSHQSPRRVAQNGSVHAPIPVEQPNNGGRHAAGGGGWMIGAAERSMRSMTRLGTELVVPAAQLREYESALRRGYPSGVPIGALEVLTWCALLGELRAATAEYEEADASTGVDRSGVRSAGVGSLAEDAAAGAQEVTLDCAALGDSGPGGAAEYVEGQQEHGGLWWASVPLRPAPVRPGSAASSSATGSSSAAGHPGGVHKVGLHAGRAAAHSTGESRRQGEFGGRQVQNGQQRQFSWAGAAAREARHSSDSAATAPGHDGAGAVDCSQGDTNQGAGQPPDAHSAASRVGVWRHEGSVGADEAATLGGAVLQQDGALAAGDSTAAARGGGRSYLGLWPLWVWDRLCIAAGQGRPRRAGGLRRAVNWLRAGLRTAAALVTVSPGYAAEIQTDAEQGMGFSGVLAQRGVHGIINGLDTDAWDPRSDPYLTPRMRYTPATAAHGKAAAKRWLQSHLGLPVSSRFPVVAYVGRLTHQKGVDVLLKALYSCIGPDDLAREALTRSLGAEAAEAAVGASDDLDASERDDGAAAATAGRWQAVLMGTGDDHLERELTFLPRTFPPRAAAAVLFDERLAHRLLAAADVLVIPSRFEPCGLVTLAALRYGAVPVVASTGGLRDIVSGRFLVAGTGRSKGPLSEPLPLPEGKPVARAFGYEAGRIAISDDPTEAAASVLRLRRAVERAVAEVGTPQFRRMQQAGMRADVGWAAPAASWHDLLVSVAEGFPESSDEEPPLVPPQPPAPQASAVLEALDPPGPGEPRADPPAEPEGAEGRD
eukprot:jgi/Ulvmu1/328/UM001_0332.1